jgi:N-acetylglutamate synthase-like GNAT family acetyltransferase
LELVGFVTLSRSSVPQVDTETMIIQYLAVSSTRQVSGVGSKIIKFITEVALSTNENFIFLEALKDDKFELIDWYSRRGFVVADPDELSDNFRHMVWMYINPEDEESINKMFNEP